jgi:hypothetical protein
MLIGVRPVFLFRAAHHQQMRDHFICRAHDAGPCVPVIANRVEAQSTQKVETFPHLAPYDGWTAPSEQVSDLAAGAGFSEMARQQI